MCIRDSVHGKYVNENGETVDPTVLADGPATDQGELALGRNILVGLDVYKRQRHALAPRGGHARNGYRARAAVARGDPRGGFGAGGGGHHLSLIHI